jgi:hypothetical protein
MEAAIFAPFVPSAVAYVSRSPRGAADVWSVGTASFLLAVVRGGDDSDSFSTWLRFRWRLRLSWRDCGRRSLARRDCWSSPRGRRLNLALTGSQPTPTGLTGLFDQAPVTEFPGVSDRDTQAFLLTVVSLPLLFRPPHASRGSPSGAPGSGRLSNKTNCDSQTALNRATHL